METKEAIKHYRRELQQAQIALDDLQTKLIFQSRILNAVREHLLINTDWNGAFEKGEDLSHIVLKVIKHGPRFASSVCSEKCAPIPDFLRPGIQLPPGEDSSI